MKLYEINEAIETLLASLMVDEETGEAPADIDEVCGQLDTLSLERTKVLEYLAKTVLNLRSDADAIGAEIERLKGRKDRMEKRCESIMKVLDRECAGQKTDLGVATVSYRSSKVTEVTDEKGAIDYLLHENYKDAVKITEPKYSIDKAAVKKLIESGIAVPGCAVVPKLNCSLK